MKRYNQPLILYHSGLKCSISTFNFPLLVPSKANNDTPVKLLITNSYLFKRTKGFSGGSIIKNTPVNSGDMGSSPRLGRSLEEEVATHSCICLENSVDRGPRWALVQGVTKRWTQLSDWACTRNDWFTPDLKPLYFTCLKFPHITKSPNQRKAIFWK